MEKTEKRWNLYYIFQLNQMKHPVPKPLLINLTSLLQQIEGGLQ